MAGDLGKGFLVMLCGGRRARKGVTWYVIWWHEGQERDKLVYYMAAGYLIELLNRSYVWRGFVLNS